MVYMNEAMKEIVGTQIPEIHNAAFTEVLEDILTKTKRIQNAVIYDNEGIEESRIDFQRVLQFAGDWTGYESSCNEIRLERSAVSSDQYAAFAEMLQERLREKYPARNFVTYIILNDSFMDVRFHTDRENEAPWLDVDLDAYTNPILCAR